MWDSVAALMIGQQPAAETPLRQQMNRNERRAQQRANASQSESQTDLKNQTTIVAEIAKNLPHPVQATLITADGENLWTVLEAESFIGTPDAMTLKHGASISGEWSVFGLLDARPEGGEFTEPFSQGGQGVATMLQGFQEFIRQQLLRLSSKITMHS